MLWFIPIESLEERYTLMTREALEIAFGKEFDFRVITADRMTQVIDDGVFLDFSDTIFYKSGQIKEIARLFKEKKIQNGDAFFIEDLWFPGVEAIKYMAMLYGLDIKITGILHAGSWTDSDVVAAMRSWAMPYERCIYNLCDKIFMGSNFIRNDFIKKFELPESETKLVVTGLPFSTDFIDRTMGEWDEDKTGVMFPLRPHLEKGIEEFLNLAAYFGAKKIPFRMSTFRKDFNFDDQQCRWQAEILAKVGVLEMKTEVSKKDFYRMLKGSRVVFSAAVQENFGYSILEAAYLGCIPVLPKRLSYVELFPEECLYETAEEAAAKVLTGVFGKEKDYKYCALKQNDNCDRMVQEIKALL